MEAAGGDVKTKGKIVIATVKGDVHDIGKNIVTVVLQCNNFEVVNMGVMVPCHEILAKARSGRGHRGPVGPHHPSLEEMRYVAGEMQKDEHFRNKKIPLLIGGATCSRVHTAVKIAPHYEGPVVYVPDASRSVGVAQSLLGDGVESYVAELNADYDKVRTQHANKRHAPVAPGQDPRQQDADRLVNVSACRARALGRRVFKNFDLAGWPNYIDWGPFFPDLGPGWPVPRHPDRRGGGRGSHARVCRWPGHAEKRSSKAVGSRQRRDGCCPPTAWATTSSSTPTTPAPRSP